MADLLAVALAQTALFSPELLAGPGEVWGALSEILRDGYRGTTLAENIGATLGGASTAGALRMLFCSTRKSAVPHPLWEFRGRQTYCC